MISALSPQKLTLALSERKHATDRVLNAFTKSRQEAIQDFFFWERVHFNGSDRPRYDHIQKAGFAYKSILKIFGLSQRLRRKDCIFMYRVKIFLEGAIEKTIPGAHGNPYKFSICELLKEHLSIDQITVIFEKSADLLRTLRVLRVFFTNHANTPQEAGQLLQSLPSLNYSSHFYIDEFIQQIQAISLNDPLYDNKNLPHFSQQNCLFASPPITINGGIPIPPPPIPINHIIPVQPLPTIAIYIIISASSNKLQALPLPIHPSADQYQISYTNLYPS